MPSLNNTKDALFEQIRKSYQTLQHACPKLLRLLLFPSGRKAGESLRNWYRSRQQTASVPVKETLIPEVTQHPDERIAAELTLPTPPQAGRPDDAERTSDSFTMQLEELAETLSTTPEMMAEMDVSKQASQANPIEQVRNTPSPQIEEPTETLSTRQEITTDIGVSKQNDLPAKKKRATKRAKTIEQAETSPTAQEITPETDVLKQNDLPAKKRRTTKRASKPEMIEQVGNIPSTQTEEQAHALSTAQEKTIAPETLEQTDLPTKKKRVTKRASQEKDTQTE